MFANQYAKEKGFNPELLQPFFESKDFIDATEGRADLAEVIEKYRTLWRWEESPSKLMELWFARENVVDRNLLAIVQEVRQNGMPVYVVTNQERHRARYLKEVMFPGLFDGFFISSEIGYRKKDGKYWAHVMKRLRGLWKELKPEEVVFFDDSADSIEGAQSEGIRAILYTGSDQVRAELFG